MMKSLQWTRRIQQIRNVVRSVDWQALRNDVDREIEGRLTIAGPVNAGKSTLFNTLIGRVVSPVSPIPGTTRTVHLEMWGPLALADTPGFGNTGGDDQSHLAWQAISASGAVVFVLDATAWLRPDDLDTLRRLVEMPIPTVIALNKIDLLGQNDRATLQRRLEQMLPNTSVVPISARTGEGIADRLLPALLNAAPDLAVPLGRALPAYRNRAAQSIIRTAALATSLAGFEPIPMIDIPLLLTVQARMVLRLAAIHGESMSVGHAKELLTTIAGGMGLRYLAQQAAKFLPGPGWLISGSVAAAGTWAMGQAALRYFESGKQIPADDLKRLYRQLLKTAPKVVEQLRKGVGSGE